MCFIDGECKAKFEGDGVGRLGKYEKLVKDGFCYKKLEQSVELKIDETYFMVSEEVMNGDMFVIVSNSATTSTHENRDGTTYVSYLGPDISNIVGRILYDNDKNEGNVVEQTDTCYGPINWVIQ